MARKIMRLFREWKTIQNGPPRRKGSDEPATERQCAIVKDLSQVAMLYLGGGNRSELTAWLRAAKSLEAKGKLVVVRLWNDQRTAIRTYAVRPDLMIDGKPIKEVNVDRVTSGCAFNLYWKLSACCRATEG